QLTDSERVAMKAQEERVLRFQTDQRLEDGGCYRVGHRHDPEHHPDRSGDFGDAAVAVSRNWRQTRADPHRLVDSEAREAVLQRLVGDVAEPGFPYGAVAEVPRGFRECLCEAGGQPIDTFG